MHSYRIAVILVLLACTLFLGQVLSSAFTQRRDEPGEAANEQRILGAKPDPENEKAPRSFPADLPDWFIDLDTDQDGQVGLYEWRAGGKNIAEFQQLDLNDDGFVTPEEFLRSTKEPIPLKFQQGRTEYIGELEEKAEERYKGKKSYKIFATTLQAGKNYQFGQISRMFQSFLHIEDPDGNVAKEHSSDSIGGRSALTFRPKKSGTYRIIATSLAGVRTGPFTLSISEAGSAIGAKMPDGVPDWFRALDHDDDGQVGLYEWRAAGKNIPEFRELDINEDGFVTPQELLRTLKEPIPLKFQQGRTEYNGELEEKVEERYKGKKSYKIFATTLQAGKNYQFGQISRMFQSFLHIEDPDGNVVKEHSSDSIGGRSALTFRPKKSGTHRIIATSLAGVRTGPFTLSISEAGSALGAKMPDGVPDWFRALDHDDDGQVGLYEWRAAGKSVSEFRELDINEDGFVTPLELLRTLKEPIPLKFQQGRTEYNGELEEKAEERYKGKKSFKVFRAKLISGQTYQFDLMSKQFQSFLHIEDPDGNIAKEQSSDSIGARSAFTFVPDRSGIYQIIATSLAGFRTGSFTLSIIEIAPGANNQ